jgi:hypothetical protein
MDVARPVIRPQPQNLGFVRYGERSGTLGQVSPVCARPQPNIVVVLCRQVGWIGPARKPAAGSLIRDLPASQTVHLLAQDVGVARMSCGLLDHVHQQPSQAQRFRHPEGPRTEPIQIVALGHDLVAHPCGSPVGGHRAGHGIGRLKLLGRDRHILSGRRDSPYTNDVDHSDAFVLLDTHLRERFIAGGMTSIGRIPANLQRLLDSQDRADLRNPGAGTWTVADALNAIGWVLGQRINVTP